MQPTESQSTPNDMLIDAAREGDIERVRALLRDAAVAQPAHDYALDEAAENGHVEVVRLLLANGADPGAHGGFPLSASAGNGRVGVVQLLLANGADPAAYDSCPLRWAAEHGYVEIARLLLAAGADPAARNDEAIRLASKNGHVEVVRFLLADDRVRASTDNYSAIWDAAVTQRAVPPIFVTHNAREGFRRVSSAPQGELQVDVVRLLLATIPDRGIRLSLVNQLLENASPPQTMRKFLASYTNDPHVVDMIDTLHVLLQLRLPDLTAEGIFALADAFAKTHVTSQMLRELHQQGQLLPFLQGAINPPMVIPSLDVTKGQGRDLARLARVSKAPPLGHMSSIPEILYTLAPSLPPRMVDRLWEVLRAQVRDGKNSGISWRNGGEVRSSILIKGVDTALSRALQELSKHSRDMKPHKNPDLAAAAAEVNEDITLLQDAMISRDAFMLEAAKKQVQKSLPVYEQCLRRIVPQQHAKIAQFLTVAASIAASQQRCSAKSRPACRGIGAHRGGLQITGPAL
jgi:Ankyrin repeats (3 copies)